MEQTVIDRIRIYIKSKNMSIRQFEAAVGLSYGYVGNIAECPSKSKLRDIFEAFPDLNRVWLLSGEGPMLKESARSASAVVSATGNGNVAMAGTTNTAHVGVDTTDTRKALALVEEAQRQMGAMLKEMAAQREMYQTMFDTLREQIKQSGR